MNVRSLCPMTDMWKSCEVDKGRVEPQRFSHWNQMHNLIYVSYLESDLNTGAQEANWCFPASVVIP